MLAGNSTLTCQEVSQVSYMAISMAADYCLHGATNLYFLGWTSISAWALFVYT